MPTKILVADDSATMRRVLEMTFAGEDARVLTVESGEAAVSKAAELQPDLVFADASMPGVDGYEVARRIKSNPQLAKVAVIVMASQHTPYDDGKGRAAGVDDHIPKPFDTQSVIDRVSQVLARPRNMPAGSEAGRAPVAPPAAPRPVPSAAAPLPPAARPPVPNATRLGMGSPAAVQPPPARPAPIPAAPPARPAPMPAAVAAAPAPAAQIRPAPAAAPAAALSESSQNALAQKLGALGLTREQVEGVLTLSREVVEQVVWEVVPVLAEQLIHEEIKRLTAD